MSDRPFDQYSDDAPGTPPGTTPAPAPPVTTTPTPPPVAPAPTSPHPAVQPTFDGPTTPPSTGDVAKQEAASVGQDVKEGAGQVAQSAKQEVQQVAQEAKGHVQSLFSQVRGDVSSQARDQQQRAAGGLHTLAGELHDMAGSTDGSTMASGLVQQAAQRLDGAAGWLEGREPADVLDEVKRYARRNPGTFLAVCGLVGLVAGRLTRGLRDDATDDGQGQYGRGTGQYAGQYGRYAGQYGQQQPYPATAGTAGTGQVYAAGPAVQQPAAGTDVYTDAAGQPGTAGYETEIYPTDPAVDDLATDDFRSDELRADELRADDDFLADDTALREDGERR